MGTRSLTAFIIKGREEIEFATMYRQFDGYPHGHGVELAEFISGGQERLYNGIGCLAAQVVAHFKITREVGGIYLEIPGDRGLGEEYLYKVYTNDKGQLMMLCYDVDEEKTIFIGTPKKFIQKYKVKETA
jgi:hypothetical protein